MQDANSSPQSPFAEAYQSASLCLSHIILLKVLSDAASDQGKPGILEKFRRSVNGLIKNGHRLQQALLSVHHKLTMVANGAVSACGVSGANAHETILNLVEMAQGSIIMSQVETGQIREASLGEITMETLKHYSECLSSVDSAELTELEAKANREAVLAECGRWKAEATAGVVVNLDGSVPAVKAGGQGLGSPGPETAESLAASEAGAQTVRMTVSEIADYVGISEKTARNWVKNGKLTATHTGGGTFEISQHELDMHKEAKKRKQSRLQGKD